MRRLALLLLGAACLASVASAQVSVLSNPPGTSSGGPATWGSVTGTLSAQTDLNSALAGKAGLTGGNTIAGTNIFSGQLKVTGGLYDVSGASTRFESTPALGAGWAGVGLEVIGNSGSSSSIIQAVNRTTVAQSQLDISGVPLNLQYNGGTVLALGSSGITLTGTQTVGSTVVFNSSGALQAAAFPALTGDISTSAGSLTTAIGAGKVTLAQQANMATASLVYRKTAGSGAPEVNTLATLKTDLGLTGTNSGDQTITLTSDVTGSGTGSFATTIAANAVTFAKFQQVAASSLVGNATGSLANATGITLAGGLAFSGSTLTAAGALTPTSVASTGAVTSSGATSGIGYATGAGGAVSQITSRATGVTNNKACGAITMFSAAGSATWATFTVTDSAVAATDTIIANEKSGTNLYMLAITSIGSGTFNLSFATTGGTATDAPVINYCVIKGVAA